MAWLLALTDEARDALKGDRWHIERFPFKVGRETRAGRGAAPPDERRRGIAPQLNDIYILDRRTELDVSREHFQIEAEAGRHELVDRGSACGTIVEGRTLGGERQGGRGPLDDHDVIIVGTSGSPFIFKFRIG